MQMSFEDIWQNAFEAFSASGGDISTKKKVPA